MQMCVCPASVFKLRKRKPCFAHGFGRELLRLPSVQGLASSISLFHLLLQPSHPIPSLLTPDCGCLEGAMGLPFAGELWWGGDGLAAQEPDKARLSFTTALREVGQGREGT